MTKPINGHDVDTFFSIQETAAILRVCTKTVRRWVKAGEMPAYRLGRQWRIRRTDLETFLKLRREG